VDEHLLVLNKPSGLLAVPGRGPELGDCLERRAQSRWPDALSVHRLDMDTSGVVVLARSREVQKTLSALFEARRVHKVYKALVAGKLKSLEGVINEPIGAHYPDRPMRNIDPNGKPARTIWRLDGHEQHGDLQASRVTLIPITGRTHQLRVHMSWMRCPILGDRLYAPDAVFEAAARLCLHAASLTLPHPATGDGHTFTAPCPF